MASRFLYPTGVLGLLTMNGSMTITLPDSVVIFVVACPSHWTSILLVCAHAASAARLKVRAPAPSLRKSRRSISMIPSWWLGQRDGAADPCRMAAYAKRGGRLNQASDPQRERFTGAPGTGYTAPHL